MEHDGELWEERLVRPLDIYPEHKAEGSGWNKAFAPGKYRNVAHFVEIVPDTGVSGIGGPVPEELAFIIDKKLKPLLLGQDPLAIERIWDRMYRYRSTGARATT